MRYFGVRGKSHDGEVVAGMVWARAFAVHELAITSDLGDVYSNVYTHMYGVLVWRDEAHLPTHDLDKHGRDVPYQAHLASRPVPDTLIVAQRFFSIVS